MKYRSKVDWWLLALVNGLALSCLVGGVWLIYLSGDWLLGGGGAAAGLAILAISWPTHYRLQAGLLLIRAGLFHWRIPVSAIQAVRPSRNPISAPAWSLKRLRVDYNRPAGRPTFVLISPRDPDLFLRDLASHDAQLELRANQLERSTQQSPEDGAMGGES